MHPLEIIWCKHLQRKEIKYCLQICINFFKAWQQWGQKSRCTASGWRDKKNNMLIVVLWGRLQTRALSREDKCLLRETVRSKRGLTLSSSYLWTKLIDCTFVGENIHWGMLLSSTKPQQNVLCALVCCVYVWLSSWLQSFGHIALILWAWEVSAINLVHYGGKLMKWAVYKEFHIKYSSIVQRFCGYVMSFCC